MDTDAFIDQHQKLWHMSEVGTWPMIQKHGLRSTTALLDLFECTGEKRRQIESERRPKSVTITHRDYGKAIIRDNDPLKEHNLRRCLDDDMLLPEWYELLNRKVFFWVAEDRLVEMLKAKNYRNREHDVIVIESRQLIARYGDRIALSPINSGEAIFPNTPKRGRGTFRSIPDYDLDAMIGWRGETKAITELAVDYAVCDLEAIALRVERRYRDSPPSVLWERPIG